MCRFGAGENQIVRWVGVQHMWLQRWCSEHFSKACEMLRNGKRKSIGVNQLESRAIGVSSSTPHDPNPFHPFWLAWLSSVHAQLMSCICSTVEWYLCLFHADEASWMGAPVRNSGVAGCEKYLSSGGAKANRSRRLDAMWTKEAQRPVNNPYTPIMTRIAETSEPRPATSLLWKTVMHEDDKNTFAATQPKGKTEASRVFFWISSLKKNYQVIPCPTEARQHPHTAHFSQASQILILTRAKNLNGGARNVEGSKGNEVIGRLFVELR